MTGNVKMVGITAVSNGQSYSTATVESSGFALGANSIAVRFRAGELSAEDSVTVRIGYYESAALASRPLLTSLAFYFHVIEALY